MPPKKRKVCNQANVALARQEHVNRHEKIKDALREQLGAKVAELQECFDEKERLDKKLQLRESEVKELTAMLRSSESTVERLEWELKEQEAKFRQEIQKNQSRNLELTTENRRLFSELKSCHESQLDTMKAKIIAQSEEMKQKKNLLEMKKKLESLKNNSPRGSRQWKKFGLIEKQDTKNSRYRAMISFMRQEIGEDDIQEFLTGFCKYLLQNNPNSSFSIKFSELDCFLAVIKWKLTDNVLKDMKSFFSYRLGFDPFISRGRIDHLRMLHSSADSFDITVRTIVKNVGSREIEVKTANVQATDVSALVSRRLERLHSSRLLDFTSPDDPVLLGVGGDKGGKHTKLVITLGNVERPNNPHGILLIGCYEGHDDYDSLREHLLPVFEMVNSLKTITYDEDGAEVTRDVVKIPVGDCKFLSAILGHRGQSCSSPCFSCNLAWTSRGQSAVHLGDDFEFWIPGDPYDASALKPPLLIVDKSSVAPPALHTILGIVQAYVIDWLVSVCNSMDFGEQLPEDLKQQKKWLRNLDLQIEEYENREKSVERACDLVEKIRSVFDSIISGRKTTHSQPCGAKVCVVSSSTLFSNPQCFNCESCKKDVHKICNLMLDAEDTNPDPSSICLDCKYSDSMTVHDRLLMTVELKEEVDRELEEIQDVLCDVLDEKEKLLKLFKKSGPARSLFERTLASMGISIKTWYQSLTGNQVRQLLRPNNIRKIMSIFPPHCSPNLDLMEQVMMDLCSIMSSANNVPKTDAEIELIENTISSLIGNLRAAQPLATITPKMHILCAHLVSYLKVHRSWGHLTEQGLEHLHAVFNSLEIRFASVTEPEKKARLILKHLSNQNFLFDINDSWFSSN